MTRLLALQFGGWPPSDRQQAAAGAGTGGQGLGGAIWALDGLLEPVAVRFRFHFEGERPTNRVDRELFRLSWGISSARAFLIVSPKEACLVVHPPSGVTGSVSVPSPDALQLSRVLLHRSLPPAVAVAVPAVGVRPGVVPLFPPARPGGVPPAAAAVRGRRPNGARRR